MARHAIKLCLLAVVLICRASNSAAQSNAPATAVCSNASPLKAPAAAAASEAAPARLFDPPAFRWQNLPFKAEAPAASNTPQSTVTLNHLASSLDERELAVIERLDREGGLRAPPPESRFQRAFEPAVVRLGHAQLTCSIVTAIKRRNPLCLINPEFLAIRF